MTLHLLLRCLYQTRKVSGHVYACWGVVSILPLSTFFFIRFWNCSDSVVFFMFFVCFIYMLYNNIHNTVIPCETNQWILNTLIIINLSWLRIDSGLRKGVYNLIEVISSWTEQIISINPYKLIQTFFVMILKNIFFFSK